MFASKKSDVDDIHEYLLLKGVEAVAIHGDKGKSLDLQYHSTVLGTLDCKRLKII